MTNKDLDIRLIQQIAATVFKGSVDLERVPQGVSTYVYRLKVGNRVYYLRILPEADRSLSMEVAVHEELSKLGVKVPKVIHYEERSSILGLSLMIVEEIPGASLDDNPPEKGIEDILFAAGKDLALLNQVTVGGFGFLAEESCGQPGEARTFQEFFIKYLDRDIKVLMETGFTSNEAQTIQCMLVKAGADMDRPVPCLVHGDFDTSHIFHHNGSFTGIIDFGDIMGCSPFFDLGHFKLHESSKVKGFGPLLAGYNQVRKLAEVDILEIEAWTLFIGVRRLGIIHGRPWHRYREFLVNKVREQMVRMRAEY